MNQTEQRYLAFESRSQQEYRNVPPHVDPPPRFPCLRTLILDPTWTRDVGILIRFIEVHGRTSFPVLSELTIGQKIQDIAKVTQLVRVIGVHIPSLRMLSLGSVGYADTRETSLKMLDFLSTARTMHVQRVLNIICSYRVMPLGSEVFWKDVEASLVNVPSFEEVIPNFAAGWDRGPTVDGLRLSARGQLDNCSDYLMRFETNHNPVRIAKYGGGGFSYVPASHIEGTGTDHQASNIHFGCPIQDPMDG